MRLYVYMVYSTLAYEKEWEIVKEETAVERSTIHVKYSDTCERQRKGIKIKSQGSSFKEKLLPQVGLEPTTFSSTRVVC